MAPTVSICIPAFERPDLLVRTLDSVLLQSYQDYEVIITDDSRNDSVERAFAPYRHHERLRYFRNARTLGSPANWNEALRHVTGRLIKILHHDDWFAGADSLGKLVELLDDAPAADLAFCASSARDEAGNEKFVHAPSAADLAQLARDPMLLFPRNIIGSPSATLFRNRSGLSFDEKTKWVVDVDFYLRVLHDNPRFVYSAEPLVCISSGIAGQVTQSCAGDVELFEWVYLYQKLSRQRRTGRHQLGFLNSLFSRLNPDALPRTYPAQAGEPLLGVVRLLIAMRALINLVARRKPS
jgi:glycosyltransferase involved in cell wall biosynthesis